MKKFIFILVVIIPLLFLLAACGKSKNKTEETQGISADSLLDDKLFADATRWKNLPQCGQILDALKKEECIKTIESNDLLDEAVQKEDKKLCDKIELDRYKTHCKTTLEQKELKAKKLAETLKKYEEENQKAYQLYLADDLEGCDEIENKNYKKQCKTNILVASANRSLDTKYCDQIVTATGDQERSDECKTTLLTISQDQNK